MSVNVRVDAGFDVDKINKFLKSHPRELVNRYENKFEDKIMSIAGRAVKKKVSIIFLSGPSASGKTTISNKLAHLFCEMGVKSAVLSLDNFYKNLSDAPCKLNGERDFESIEALETALLTEKLNEIAKTKRAKIPLFDFLEGKRKDDEIDFDVGQNGIAIVEGIHALNDNILSHISNKFYIAVYASIHSNFVNEKGIVLPKRSARFIQRLVRDYNFRGSSGENTLKMWNSVCEGEDLYIRPNSKNAQIHFDSTIPYSPSVLKNEAISILNEVDKSSEYYNQAKDFIEGLLNFDTLDLDFVPKTSVLREFTGGGIF